MPHHVPAWALYKRAAGQFGASGCGVNSPALSLWLMMEATTWQAGGVQQSPISDNFASSPSNRGSSIRSMGASCSDNFAQDLTPKPVKRSQAFGSL